MALAQQSRDLIGMAALDGTVLFVNRGGRQMLGIEPGDELTLARFHTDDGMKRAHVLKEQGYWADLNAIVAGIERMARRLLREDVQLTAVLEPTIGSVKVDVGQIEQVILNLAVNARDAMPAGGKLTIATATAVVDDTRAGQGEQAVPPGRYVTLRVSDTGVGMDGVTLARVFEPFFTTKPQGVGTGLGLATVFGIVKQSGGHITVTSRIGEGTTFTVYLPC